jgi:hypothetical protein
VALQAKAEAIQRPILEWEPCGDGCDTASLEFGFGPEGAFQPSAGVFASGDGSDAKTYLSLVLAERRGTGGNALHYSIRLDDGQLMGLLKLDVADISRSCGFGNSPDSAFSPLINGRPLGVYGVFHPVTGAWSWYPPWTDQSMCEPFHLHDPSGDRLLSSCGSVGGFLTPGSGEVGVIASGVNAIGGSGTSYGGLAVWAEGLAGGRTRLRGWRPGGSPRTLHADVPGLICQLAATPNHLVGLLRSPGSYCNGMSPEVRIWYAPWAENEPGAVTLGPPLASFGLSVSRFDAWNDFAVLWVTDAPTLEEYGLVVRFSDWSVRRIIPQAGMDVHFHSLAVTDRHVYWGEGVYPKGTHRASRMYRFDLSRFDQLGEPFVGTLPVDAPGSQ